jgi:pyruvate dehydrogenase E1 component beta subunit
MPATAFDAKGLLLESIFGEDPTIIIEGRGLFSMKEEVPEKPYRVRFGKALVRRVGYDATLVALGSMVPPAMRAAEILAQEGISVEVVDPRTISPLDRPAILESVSKTGHLVVAEPGWHSFGAAAEIIAAVAENQASGLKSPPVRVNFPDSHTPMSMALEKLYYPGEQEIAEAVRGTLKKS